MGGVAQAGARAALADADWLAEVQARVTQSRDAIAATAVQNGLTPLPSATNFVTVDCGRDGAYARRVLSALLQAGIFVRMPGVAPLDRCIRIGCGTAADMDALRAALPEALEQAQS